MVLLSAANNQDELKGQELRNGKLESIDLTEGSSTEG